MQLLTNKYKDKRVLVVGGKATACADLAKGYGFENVVTPQDLHHWNTSLWPYSQPKDITEASQKRNNDLTMSVYKHTYLFRQPMTTMPRSLLKP
jgi:ribonucleotide monophosphatase NagD (HAD superfamily)